VFYTLPKSCEWTLTSTGTVYGDNDKVYKYVSEHRVNGLFVKVFAALYEGDVLKESYLELIRVDLSEFTDNVTAFGTSYSNGGEGGECGKYQMELWEFHQWRTFPKIGTYSRYGQLPYKFTEVKKCGGNEKCKIYSSDKGAHYELYTEMDDTPIKAVVDGSTYEFKFVKEAPLSLFKFDATDTTCGVVGVYKAPNSSICYDTENSPACTAADSEVSSASIEVLSSFVLILSIFAVFLNF